MSASAGVDGDAGSAAVVKAPPARGWHHHPEDPAGVTRWYDGTMWTNELTGGSARDRAEAVVIPGRRSTPRSVLPAERVGAPAHPAASPAPVLPGLASTVVVTVLFGVFGVVPAAVNTAVAGYAGRPTGDYWTAFALSLVGSGLLYALVFLVVL